jgi:hypothetical protein
MSAARQSIVVPAPSLFRRGRGITVAGTPDRSAITSRAPELVGFARQHGYGPTVGLSAREISTRWCPCSLSW